MFAVGGEVGIFVLTKAGHQVRIVTGGINRRKIESALRRATYKCHAISPVRPNRRVIVAAIVGETGHPDTVGVGEINLRRAGAVGCESEH